MPPSIYISRIKKKKVVIMENQLETIYKEEYVRAKARYDYEQHRNAKSNRKKEREKRYIALGHILWGSAVLYLIYRIYLIFI